MCLLRRTVLELIECPSYVVYGVLSMVGGWSLAVVVYRCIVVVGASSLSVVGWLVQKCRRSERGSSADEWVPVGRSAAEGRSFRAECQLPGHRWGGQDQCVDGCIIQRWCWSTRCCNCCCVYYWKSASNAGPTAWSVSLSVRLSLLAVGMDCSFSAGVPKHCSRSQKLVMFSGSKSLWHCRSHHIKKLLMSVMMYWSLSLALQIGAGYGNILSYWFAVTYCKQFLGSLLICGWCAVFRPTLFYGPKILSLAVEFACFHWISAFPRYLVLLVTCQRIEVKSMIIELLILRVRYFHTVDSLKKSSVYFINWMPWN